MSLDEVNNYLLRANIMASAILGTKYILVKNKNKIFTHMTLKYKEYVYIYKWANAYKQLQVCHERKVEVV